MVSSNCFLNGHVPQSKFLGDVQYTTEVRCNRSLFHSDSTLLRSLWRNSGLIVTWYIEHNLAKFLFLDLFEIALLAVRNCQKVGKLRNIVYPRIFKVYSDYASSDVYIIQGPNKELLSLSLLLLLLLLLQ